MQSLIKTADDIRTGKTSAEDALSRSFDAIERQEADIKAFEAIAEREPAVRHAGSQNGPLAGMAIGVKDIFDTAGLATTYGSPIYKDQRPCADAPVVAMARAAGATIIGKTVTTEFAFFHPGKTRNPHNLEYSPGGSSSGSAAAVAAGMIPAAIGTQTGGSIIRPASFCGVAGYKPSFRQVPVTGMKAFSWSLDTTGFFAASVADVALFAELVTGRPLQIDHGDARPPKIGLYRTGIWNEADKNMRQAIETAAARAATAGAKIIEIEEPQILTDAREVHSTIQNFEGALALSGEYRLYRDLLSKKLIETIKEGQQITQEDYHRAQKIAREARHVAGDLFSKIDVLMTPSAPGIAPKGLESTGEPTFNKLWTLTGNPCVGIPGMTDPDGMPLGIQLVGQFGRDEATIQAAFWLESAMNS